VVLYRLIDEINLKIDISYNNIITIFVCFTEMMNIEESSSNDLQTYYDNVLNKDKSTYKTSNDEPTPLECIKDMLNVLPVTFWEKEHLRILDPCCGNGNFHSVAFHKLKNYKDTREILEEILYFNDVNLDRIKNVKQIFCEDKYNLHISSTDFLQIDYNIRFDAIIANPPYAKIMENGQRASKNHNLIKEFLEKSLSILKPGGYLVFITPDNWMSYANRNELIGKLTELQIVHLNIHTAKKYFKKIGSSFTWYVIENTKHYKPLRVEGIYKNKPYDSLVPSGTRRYIPLFYTSVIHSILKKTVDNTMLKKFKVETSSDLHKYTKKSFINDKQTDEFTHKLIHTPKQTVWASRPHKYQEGYKVFISTTDRYQVFVDCCGMTQSIVFIRCVSKDEAEQIKNILLHPLYIFVNNICRWGNFNNIRILQNFPVPDNAEDVFSSFAITKEEQEIISSFI
jgi:adenine-specific DNA-methyltransferase